MADPQRGVVKFNPTDHELYRLVQKRVSQKLSWAEIAAEIGCEVMPLCEWVLGYKEPERLPMVRSDPIRANGVPIRAHRDMSRQFIVWKRAHDGAQLARSINWETDEALANSENTAHT